MEGEGDSGLHNSPSTSEVPPMAAASQGRGLLRRPALRSPATLGLNLRCQSEKSRTLWGPARFVLYARSICDIFLL